METTDATLLAAPLTNGRSMDTALLSRCDDLSRSIERLGLVAEHDALLLLRASISALKLMHTLRSSSCADNPMLDRFDSLLRKGVCTISNTELSDIQWIQDSLPVRNGGLGSDVLTRLHLPPSWHQLQEHATSRTILWRRIIL